MRKLFCLFFLTFFAIGLAKGLHFLKDGFSPRRLHCLDLPANEEWGEEVAQILAKPFRYLGRGRQCFAFESLDEKYVIKFPRTDIYKTPLWVRALPLKAYRKNLEAKHLHKEQFILASVDISLNELKEQTGLLAVHFGKSSSQGKKISAIDNLGCTHLLPLEKTSFILQYKWPLLTKLFSTALQNGEKGEAKRILDALIDVIIERSQKGIFNKDPSFLRNYGFDGEKAHPIDIGTFCRMPELDPALAPQKSIDYSMGPIRDWLGKTDPEMLEHLNNKLLK